MSSRPPSRDRAAANRSAAIAGRGVFVAVIAVGIGLLVLKNGFADSNASTGSGGATTTAAPASTTVPPSTTVPANAAPAKVLVANGSGKSGVAKKAADFLTKKGIQTAPPVDATKKDYPATVIFYREGFQAQAQQVSQQLGGAKVEGVIPNPPPVANVGDANVIVVVGKAPIAGVTA
jgi:hypothetical protein